MRNRNHLFLIENLFLYLVQLLPTPYLFTLNFGPAIGGDQLFLVVKECSNFIDGGRSGWKQVSFEVELKLLECFE